ncbi:MAG: phosphoribosylglycinamide formyltransferase [Epsilonproteobacteria bacterium]|nr:phosphoribosylglycinamide formyltransferase [Campylobacterota bacterium]MBD3839541.1 phosphoribosylglycinamide formyltransferase [Campylobacterota bacterium]
MKKIAILFSGTGSNLAYILEHLHQKKVEVVLTITNNPEANGIEYAKKYNIPCVIIDSKAFSLREDFDRRVVEEIQKYNVDLSVLAGFMRILTPVFTDNIKSINLHPSLLPRFKGLKAIERTYESDDVFGGVSVHWVNSELDAGEIIVQKQISKVGLSFDEYLEQIKTIEKIALCEAIEKSLQ